MREDYSDNHKDDGDTHGDECDIGENDDDIHDDDCDIHDDDDDIDENNDDGTVAPMHTISRSRTPGSSNKTPPGVLYGKGGGGGGACWAKAIPRLLKNL